MLAAPALRAEALASPIGSSDLESDFGGRLGVCVLDVASGRRMQHRADERFAMCSTFKVLAVGLLLTRVDRDQERLDRRIVYSRNRLVTYSPETEKHAGDEGMTVAEICKAALTLSDNTAANLILESIGGPPGVTAFARRLGDDVTRLDRAETELNEARPGDPRDTTTPAAMLENLRKILIGDALSKHSREQLTTWMAANRTGDHRLRAGVSAGWRVADKTGSGGHNQANDVAVLWRPSGGPIIVTAYLADAPAAEDARSEVFSEIGRRAAQV